MRSENLNLFMDAGATFSPCKKYRYRLWRHWENAGKPMITWILLNPSTADEIVNDPTVERCERRARQMGYGGMELVNIFAFRSTDPVIMKQQEDPIGPDNDRAIIEAAQLSGLVVCAWGTHGAHLERGKKVAALLRHNGILLHCLTETASGHPGHPLYVGYDVLPKPFGGLL